jgi:acyl-CoA synthetase (AMP-forming)/AMP-acid ligase II
MLGSVQVILPAFDPVAVLRAIERHQVHDTVLVPTMIQVLLDHPEMGRYDLSSIRTLGYAGAPITQTLLERAMKALPHASFVQYYGMTELSPITTLLDPADHSDKRRARSAGRAAVHAEVRIVDTQDHEVPRGTVGEIACRGAHMMLGYWNRPEDGAEATRGGWMHTGDAGYMDQEGYVYVVDRLKDMIISGGENVYSAEVENALAKHPAVAACAVIGVPDSEWGERVHALVVLKRGHSADPKAIREHCKSSIAAFKAPRSVDFVDALPVSSAGKVLKHELRKRYRQLAEERR